MPTELTQILDALEDSYGPQKLTGPNDPCEMIVFLNSGHLQAKAADANAE